MAVRTDQHVLELEIAVDHTLSVDEIQALAQVLVPAGNLTFVGAARRHVRERARFARVPDDEVHHEIGTPRGLVHAHVRHAHDARMRQLRQQPPLREEPVSDLRHVAAVGEELEGVAGAEADVLHLVHLAHAALAKLAHDFIRTESHGDIIPQLRRMAHGLRENLV